MNHDSLQSALPVSTDRLRSSLPGGRKLTRWVPMHRQQGVALAISLVLLVAMTIVGIATLSGTRLNEKVTSNAQQKSVAFEVAESVINVVYDRDTIRQVIEAPAADYAAPAAITPPGIADALSDDFNQVKGTRSTLDIDGFVTVQVCGESLALLPSGTEINADTSSNSNFGQILVDINGIATIENSATRSDHVQRVADEGPQTGRTGACTSPGI